MALLGPSPNPSSVASLVRNASDDRVFEILEEVLQFTDGPILTHLSSNALTRKRLVSFLTPEKLKESLPLLQDISDPDYVALSFLADDVDSLRQPILDLVTTDAIKPSLTVLSRLLAKQKLDLKTLSNELVDRILTWTQVPRAQADNAKTSDADTPEPEGPEGAEGRAGDSAKEDHWYMLATVLAKALAESHRSHIIDFARTNLGSDRGYAAIRATVDQIPELVDLVWQTTPLEPLSPDYLHMLSILANSRENREKLRQESRLFSLVTKAADGGNAVAAVVEAKALAGVTSQTGDIAAAAERLNVLSHDIFEKNVDEVTLEGLACTARLATVRDRISHQISVEIERRKPTATKAPTPSLVELSLKDEKKKSEPPTVIEAVVALLKSKPSTTAYGVLAVLIQLATYPIKPTKDEERERELRIQTLGKSVFDTKADVEIDNENDKFHARQECGRICDQILSSSVISWLAQNAGRLSTASHVQLAIFLRELSVHQESRRREREAIQGAAVVAMYLWSKEKPMKLEATTRSIAASVVAKILTSVPYEVALTEKVSPLVVVQPLVEQIYNESSPRQNLDTFETLLALTNLASVNSNQLRLLITRRVWERLVPALNSEFVQIRRAALQLVCNLMLVAQSASHFLQHTKESDELLGLLGRSVICDDEDSRIAAAGALAMLAEWETAPETIGRSTECVESLSRSLGLFMEDDVLLVRVLAALKTILKSTIDDMNDEVVEKFVFYEGATHLEELVDAIDPVSRGEIAKRTLQCIKMIAEYKYKGTSH